MHDKIKKYITLGMMSFFVFTSNTISALATVEYELTKQCQTIKELSIDNYRLHLKNIDGYTYIVDKCENIRYGWSYDSIGNLYYTELGSEAGIIKSGKNSDGISFDENGVYINPSFINVEKNFELSKRFEQGEWLYFENTEKLFNFFEYYEVQYRLSDSVENYRITHNDDGSYTVKIPEKAKYDREDLINQIIEKIGDTEGETEYEKIYSICKNIGEYLEYDLSYITTDMETSLRDKKGVCRQYTKIASVLLNEEGIDHELMEGQESGADHIWLRCFVNGKWTYVDVTGARDKWRLYGNITYEVFTETYVPKVAMMIE